LATQSDLRIFASLKLAVVLLAVLIIAAIAGAIYESSFDAKVARAYVYGAPWFNLWLVSLAANLTASALSRWPRRKHHITLLIAHLGMITLLIGSLIGRIWGIEGFVQRRSKVSRALSLALLRFHESWRPAPGSR
jgi:cytochrome c biogenesis protein ResB